MLTICNTLIYGAGDGVEKTISGKKRDGSSKKLLAHVLVRNKYTFFLMFTFYLSLSSKQIGVPFPEVDSFREISRIFVRKFIGSSYMYRQQPAHIIMFSPQPNLTQPAIDG